MRSRNYKIILTVTLGFLLSFSAASAKNFNIFNAATPSQSYFTVNGTSGNVGIGMTNPSSLLQILNNGWISAQNSAGNGVVNMFKVNANDQIEVGAPLNIGSFEFSPDSGLVSFVDMPVTSAAASGTPEGYAFKVDGDNIMTAYSESNGAGGIQNKRLGIGLTNPAVSLDVAGTLRNTLATTHSLLGGAGNVIVMADNTGALYSTSTAGFSGGTNFWGGTKNANIWNGDAGAGNVGIGTTAPAQKLTVGGGGNRLYFDASSFGTKIVFNNAGPTNYMNIGAFGTATSSRLGFGYNTNPASDTITEAMSIVDNGYVGIGKTNPVARLDVLSATSSIAQFNGPRTQTSFSIVGGVDVGQYWRGSFIGQNIDLDGTTGKPKVNTTNYRAGAIGFAPDNTEGYIGFFTTASTTAGDNLPERMRINSLGNVGIGTTAPGAKLAINQGSYGLPVTSGATQTYGAFRIEATAAGNVILDMGTSGDSSGTWLQTTNKSDLSLEYPLLLNPNGGNVGIGTTNPGSKLDVQGTASSTFALRVLNNAGAVRGGLYLTSAQASQFYLYDEGGVADVVLSTVDQSYFNGGNVGIGLTNPTTKLYVSGTSLNTLATTHSLLGGAGNVLVMADNTGALYATSTAGFSGGVNFWGGTKNGNIWNGDAGAGNVGIGTTNPTAKLTVSGEIRADWGSPITIYNGTGVGIFGISRQNDVSNASAQIAAYGGIGFTTGLSSGLITPASTSSSMWISTGGNVGIGTTTPLASLHIYKDSAANVGTILLDQPTAPTGSTSKGPHFFMRSAGVNRGWIGFFDNASHGDGTTLNLKSAGDVRIGAGDFGNDGDVIITSAGNVGIGLTNPTTKLYVSGTSLNTLATTHSLLGGAGNVLVMADNTGALYATSTAGFSGGVNFWGGTKNGNIWNGDAGAGNVGIGTTAPDSILSVRSASQNAVVNIYGISATTDYGVIQVSTSGGLTNPNNRPLVLQPNAGNVGIGTTTPNTNLVVNTGSAADDNGISIFTGATYNDPSLKIGRNNGAADVFRFIVKGTAGSGVMNIYGGSGVGTGINLQGGGNVGIGTTSPVSKLHITDSGVTTLSLESTAAYSATPSVSINTILKYNAAGSSTNMGKITFAKNNAVDGDTSAYTAFYKKSNGVALLEAMRIDPAGNVGIGLTNPTTKLYVSGTSLNTLATTHSLLGGAGNVLVMADNTGALYATSTAGFSGGVNFWGGTKNGNIWNGDSGAGNVGIGETNPTARLNILGTYNSQGFKLVNDRDDGGIRFQVYDPDDINGGVVFSGGSYMNVGIGTTTPQAQLAIENANTDGGIIMNLYDHWDNVSALKVENPDGGSSGVMISQSGNVGIGTSTPKAQLAVAIGRSDGDLMFNLYDPWDNVSAFKVENSDGSNSGVIIKQTGNVGIAITNPTVRLDVSGTFRNTLATTHSLLGGAGNVLVMADNTGALYATSTAGFSGGVNFWGGTKNGNIWNGDAGAGNVGIGTTTLVGKLTIDVANSSQVDANSVLYSTDYNNPGIRLGYTGLANLFGYQANNNVGNGESYGTVLGMNSFYDGTNWYTKNGWIQPTFIQLVEGSVRFMATSTHQGGANGNFTPSERMRITGTGNVGIGTTNPGFKLEVKNGEGASTNNVVLSLGNSNAAGESAYMRFTSTPGYDWSVGKDISGSQNDNFGISSDNSATVQFTIKNDGNVGIGTTNPAGKLDVSAGLASQTAGDLVVDTANTTVYVGKLDSVSGNSTFIFRDRLGNQKMKLFNAGSGSFFMGNFNQNYGLKIQSGVVTAIAATATTTARLEVDSGVAAFPSAVFLTGNVGIGLTNPATKLDVSGTLRNTLATTHSLLGGSGDVLVMADNSGNLYATSTAGFGAGGSYLPLTGGSLSGNLNMGSNNITNINKLTVNTIDPLYNIQGVNYSTFAASIAGGVKEEYVGRVKINNLTDNGEREYVVDFNNLAVGSDLWVWRKTVDFSAENVEVIATPYGSFAQVYYKIEDNKIIFRADRKTTISYRLSGRRVDWKKWPTKALDQEEQAGFVIE